MTELLVPALTVQQPWASLIMAGAKVWEWRNWHTEYRGLLWIHAAKEPPVELEVLRREEDFRRALGEWEEDNPLPCGKLLGQVELLDCCLAKVVWPQLTELERELGTFRHGNYAWKLRVVEVLHEPWACPGRRGLWYPPFPGKVRSDQRLWPTF